jgi:hypothetical protein
LKTKEEEGDKEKDELGVGKVEFWEMKKVR